jgi:hypothetical protein
MVKGNIFETLTEFDMCGPIDEVIKMLEMYRDTYGVTRVAVDPLEDENYFYMVKE